MHYIHSTIAKVLNNKSEELIDLYVPPESKLVEKSLQETQNKTITEAFMKEFEIFRQKEYINPILGVAQSLPKEEMAAMAEALVELTALRRRVGSPLESVGGPTDVAFISKGDGFIWIKRKHYFDIAFNGDYAKRRSGI